MLDKIYDMEGLDKGGASWQSSSALTENELCSIKSAEFAEFFKENGNVNTIQQILERSKLTKTALY